MSKFTESIYIAFQVAFAGFEKSYRRGESLDVILGYSDCLTNLPNRKAFERDRNAVGYDDALIMIDIDDFKSVNDIHGHLYGDEILQRLAGVLRMAVGVDGKVFRIGGDEFIIIVPNNQVNATCDYIRHSVKKEDGYTISQGVVLNLQQGITRDTVHLADTALYESKARGKDKITVSIPVIARAG